jgi:hypothetical protein
MSERIYNNPSESETLSIASVDSEGEVFEIDDAISVEVVLSREDAQYFLDNYDANSGTSPLVAEARPIARAVLNALKKFIEEGG